MTGILEAVAAEQRIAAARVHNARRAAMASDLWLYGLAEDRDPRDIQRDVDSLEPERCAEPRCRSGNAHPTH